MAVGAERHTPNPAFVAAQRAHLLTLFSFEGSCVPDADAPVETRRHNPVPVWAEGNAKDPAAVSAQGAAAEVVSAVLIGTAGFTGLPVSTTHIVTSGISGTMVTARAGLQYRILSRILIAWCLVTVLARGGDDAGHRQAAALFSSAAAPSSNSFPILG